MHEDEGQHLQTVYQPAYAFGGPGLFGFVPEARLDESSPLATAANARRLMDEWEPHWDTSKPFLAEKSPPNLIRTRFLQTLFPGCRFIVVLRHPIAVSYATQKWTPRTTWIHTLLRHWVTCHEQFLEDETSLHHVHVLRYEDFVAEPQRQLDQMYAFLDLPSEPLKRDVRTGVNDRYFAAWDARRRSLLTRPYTAHVIRRFEPSVQQFGYSLADHT